MATPTKARTRRPGGSGNLYVRTDAAGGETWYATWYEHGRKVKRRIGRKDGEHGPISPSGSYAESWPRGSPARSPVSG